MRRDVQPLLLELDVFIRFLGDDHGHLHPVHVIQYAGQLVALLLGLGGVALLDDVLFLYCPVVLHLVIHPHRREFVHGNDHTLSEETPAGKMMGDILGDLVDPVLPLDDLQYPRRRILKQPGFIVVQVFLLDDIHHIVIQEVVLQTDLRHTAGIEQRHRRSVLHRLGKVVFRHIIAEPLVGQPLAAQQRGACKGDVVGVGQPGAHILCQILVLSPMGFIHQHKDIVPRGENGIFLPLVIAELVDQREYEGLVGLQIIPQLLPVLRLAFLFGADHLGFHEILVNLIVQVLAVRDDEEGEIAGHLPSHLAGEEHHGVGFAGALGVPEHAQLAVELGAIRHRFHQVVHAEILVVLGNDLVFLVAEHDEVLDVIDQPVLPQQAVDEIPHGALPDGAGVPDGLPVRVLPLRIHLQPLEEVIVAGVERPEPGFQPVGEHADLIEGKQVRNVPQIVFQVVVIGFLHLDDAVFQLNEHHRHAVDVQEHVRPPPVEAPLNPHLGDGGEGVVRGVVEIHQLHEGEVLLAVPAHGDPDAVSDFVVELIVGRRHVRGGVIPAKLPEDVV